ncbi:MAG: hypothetical protein JWM74_1815 [Myxococcaceae bacterium]|nr:hypothetical protein [Myxococcaceae bacterium]
MTDDVRTRTLETPASSITTTSLRVTVVEGPDTGKTAVLSSTRAILGRAASSEMALSDPTVSQFHAELRVEDGGVMVVDLGSRNGTRAGDVVLKSGIVPFGAELVLGSTKVKIEQGERYSPERSGATSFGGLVGSSAIMRELYAMLERLARTDLTVLIEGDTGTGKEVAARALHELGRRAAGPFVVLDCTAIPPNLAESVLFGHEKGAFTGANDRRIGLFEAAHGGTLFIDELGELPADLQPKLLRVLERREVVAVGASKPRPVDVRIVSATWRDTRTLVNQGTFREDLYYRLAQARVRLPTLMERPEDIKPLVQHFLAKIPWDVEAARAITNEALESIATRSFPGNVRELKTTVERVAMLAEGATIAPGDLAFERILAVERGRTAPRGMRMSALPPQPSSQSESQRASQPSLPPSADDAIENFKDAKRTLIDDFEKGYLARLLARAGTNISRAASLAGIERQSLRDLLKKHGLRGEG